MALYREQGVVLRTWKLGETDRIVSLLTPGRGKVRAVAKGVRRPGSRFGGRLEPYSHVDLQLYEGRELDVVNQAEGITPFAEIRADWVLSACASAMVEGADRIAQEDERSNRLFLLLLEALRTLQAVPAQPALVLDAYLFRLAAEAGYAPALDQCASCGSPGPHAVFAIGAGGALCRGCAPFDSHPLARETVDLLVALMTADWRVLHQLSPEARARRAVGSIVGSYFSHHLGRPLKAWDLVPR